MSFPKNFALLQIIEKQKYINKLVPSLIDLQSPVHLTNQASIVNKLNKVKEEINCAKVEKEPNSSRLFKKNDKEQERICPVHNKKMDLFCLEDQERICTNCALFGPHKNHEIEEEEEVLKKINSKAEKMLEILEKLEGYDENKISFFSEIGNIYEFCLMKRSTLTTKIQEKFSVIIHIIDI